LIGVFEIAVKTAFLAWEAAVLPLNYARERHSSGLGSDLTQRTLSELSAICNPFSDPYRGSANSSTVSPACRMIERTVPVFRVSTGMNRNGYRTRRVVGIDENVMTADNSIDEKACSRESLNDTLTADDRKLSAAH